MSINKILYQYWRSLHKEDVPPVKEQVSPDELMEIWQNCFILDIDVTGHKLSYKYRHFGEEIIRAYEKDLSIEHDSPPLVSIDPEALSGTFEEIIYHQNPIIEDNKIIYSDRGIITYNQCMLPLKATNNIYTLIGGMQHKILEQ